MDLFLELNNLILKHRFYPKKGSGIHFIIKEKLINEILALLDLKKSDKVFEVFAGEFFAARQISAKAKLKVFEKRKELIPLIKNELPKAELILNFPEKINANKCFSFIPQKDSSENFFDLIFFDFDLMVLLFHKDFAEKILAEPGFVDYNVISVLTDCFFEIKEVIEVKSNCFFPAVSGDFFLIKLTKKNKTKIKNKKDFFEFVKILFRFKNRTFISVLSKAIPLMKLNKKTKEKIKKNAFKTDFSEKIYLMETRDFVELFSLLTE